MCMTFCPTFVCLFVCGVSVSWYEFTLAVRDFVSFRGSLHLGDAHLLLLRLQRPRDCSGSSEITVNHLLHIYSASILKKIYSCICKYLHIVYIHWLPLSCVVTGGVVTVVFLPLFRRPQPHRKMHANTIGETLFYKFYMHKSYRWEGAPLGTGLEDGVLAFAAAVWLDRPPPSRDSASDSSTTLSAVISIVYICISKGKRQLIMLVQSTPCDCARRLRLANSCSSLLRSPLDGGPEWPPPPSTTASAGNSQFGFFSNFAFAASFSANFKARTWKIHNNRT